MELKHPFDAELPIGHALLKFLLGNMARGKDNFLANTGPEGSGKTTTSGNLVLRMAPDFDVERDTIMDMDHLLDVLYEGKKGRVYLLDEAINIFHNQDWSTWEAKSITKIVRQMRIMKSTWIVNVPDFTGLHPYLRDYRVRVWLYHEPVFESDGMSNGPAKLLWRNEWFSYREQAVVSRWLDVGDIEADSLDDDPSWAPYEGKKVRNFISLVKQMKDRRQQEEARAVKRAKKAAKNGGSDTTPHVSLEHGVESAVGGPSGATRRRRAPPAGGD